MGGGERLTPHTPPHATGYIQEPSCSWSSTPLTPRPHTLSCRRMSPDQRLYWPASLWQTQVVHIVRVGGVSCRCCCWWTQRGKGTTHMNPRVQNKPQSKRQKDGATCVGQGGWGGSKKWQVGLSEHDLLKASRQQLHHHHLLSWVTLPTSPVVLAHFYLSHISSASSSYLHVGYLATAFLLGQTHSCKGWWKH